MQLLRFSLLGFLALFLTPLALHAIWWLSHDTAVAWNRADWSSARLLPPASGKPEAIVHVYAARTGRWKGIFAHHSWVVIKERGSGSYTRYDKVAWGRPVKIDNWAPDARWYGHQPTLVGSVEGPAAEALIPKIKAAVARYPYNRSGGYSVWPGPNSNSFVSYVLAAIPEFAHRLAADGDRQGLARSDLLCRPDAQRHGPCSCRSKGCSACRSVGSKASKSTCWVL